KHLHHCISSDANPGRLVLQKRAGWIRLKEPASTITYPGNQESRAIRPCSTKLGIGLHMIAEFFCQGFNIHFLIVCNTIDLAFNPRTVDKSPGIPDKS